MREATPEEQKSVEDYVRSISVDTGVNFFEDHSKNQQKNQQIQDGNMVKEEKQN